MKATTRITAHMYSPCLEIIKIIEIPVTPKLKIYGCHVCLYLSDFMMSSLDDLKNIKMFCVVHLL